MGAPHPAPVVTEKSPMPSSSDADAALRQSLARLRAILDATVDAIVTIDEAGVIESANQATERMFGYQPDELIGQNVSVLMPQPFRQEHDGYIARYLETREPRIIGIGREVPAQRKDGSVFPVHLAVSEVQLENRRIFTGIVRDISERHNAEFRLRELQKRAHQRDRLADIGAITAKVAHDLGNPLAAVAMQAQFVLRRATRDPAQPAAGFLPHIERMVGELRRLDGLLKDLMSVAREQRLGHKLIDIAAFLSHCIQLWRPIATARDVALHAEVAEPGLTVWADEEKLRRVLDNLVKNAIEAIDRGPGAVWVRARPLASDKVCLSVEDTGPGFPSDITPFSMFETTKADGTGLGLAISKEIIAAHGGQIELLPGNPNGAVIRVCLFRSDPHGK